VADGDYTAGTDWPCFVVLSRSESKLLFQLDTGTHKGILKVVPCPAMMTSDKNEVCGNLPSRLSPSNRQSGNNGA
jgi:hypothetical protein